MNEDSINPNLNSDLDEEGSENLDHETQENCTSRQLLNNVSLTFKFILNM